MAVSILDCLNTLLRSSPRNSRVKMLMEGVPPPSDPIEDKHGHPMYADDDLKAELDNTPVDDPFGNEATAEVKYKTLKWW